MRFSKLIHGLLIAEVAAVLQDQTAHHDFGGVSRTPDLAGITLGQQYIDDRCRVSNVDMQSNDLQ